MYFNSLSHKHFQKIVSLIIACFVCVGVFVGIGASAEKISQINSTDDLIKFRNSVNDGISYVGETVYLNTDIDISNEMNWKPIGSSSYNFNGVFDGQGHVISYLRIYDDGAFEKYGLFGETNGATIKNLILENVYAHTDGCMTGTTTIGCLIGSMVNGNVINCSVSGRVMGGLRTDCVGGLIGMVAGNGKIDNCSVSLEGDITSSGTYFTTSCLGGLIGYCEADDESRISVSNCFVMGNGYWVSGSSTDDTEIACVGGLTGCMAGCDVSNCFVLLETGLVRGGDKYVGGLIGEMMESNVNNCFASSAGVSPNEDANSMGGLIGYIHDGSNVSNCYTTSDVYEYDDNYLGGLVGYVDDDCHVNHCVALNPSVKHDDDDDDIGRVVGYKGDADVSQNYGWNQMLVNGKTVAGGSAENGMDTTSEDVWESVSFWQNVFGADSISYDGTTTWTIDKYKPGYEHRGSWGLPYLTQFGKPRDNQTSGIDHLNPYPSYFPIAINSVDDLRAFQERVGRGEYGGCFYVTLNTNLDLKDEEEVISIGHHGFDRDYAFNGLFEGNGYTISNVRSHTGLFGLINGTLITNLTLKNVSVFGESYGVGGGGLVGEMNGSSLLNCMVIGNVANNGNNVGGLVGYLENCDICNCSADCVVTGREDVGGLIGNGTGGNVNNCFAYGEIYGVNGVGGLVGKMSSGSITNSFASGFIVGEGNALGGLVGSTGDELKILNSLALNHYINGNSSIQRVSGGSLQTIENTFAWDDMTLNGNLVSEGGLNGMNATSSDVWKNLTFWQSVLGADNISDDGTKMWNLITSEDESLWGLPYLASLGKPSDKDAEKIQYLIPMVHLTQITYNDGQYANKLAMSQNKLPHITLYKDVFDIMKKEGSNQSFSLDTSAPWENSYLWQNNSHPITFAEVITDNVSWNDLESVDAMKNQNITFALGDENSTSISGTERNVSVTVENYLQSYTNNSLDKTRTTDGWFFDTPYTVSLAVRPGPEAYHASEQNGKLWNSHVLIQNLTNNVGKQDSVAWRFATDTKNTTYNNYTVDNQAYLNSTEYLQVKSAESADDDNVNITLTGYKLGDVNRNDVVNINDISAMIKLILAAAKDNNTYEAALKAFPNTRIENLIYADDNKKGGDGLIDVGDLLVINDWLVNGSANFNYDGWE